MAQALADMTIRRREAVASLSGKKPAEISEALRQQGLVNPTTGKPYSRQTIRADLREVARRQPPAPPASTPSRPVRVRRENLAETIGRFTYVKPQWPARILLNVDAVWIDYPFFDALRRGEAPGFEISGPAFCLPAAQTTTSYVYGKGISASLVESAVPTSATKQALHEAAEPLSEQNGKPTQNKRNALNQPGSQPGRPAPKPSLAVVPKAKPSPNATDPIAFTNLQLRNFLRQNLGPLLQMTVDNYCLGNQFVFVNPDCSLSVASPETVTVEYSASDYRRVVRVIVKTKMQQANVEDVYTDDKRVITTHYYDERGTVKEEYENLIGRIPMVHFANDRSANEIYGRPLFMPGLPVMAKYDALINNMLEGVTLLGTPIPVFEGLDNPTETKNLNCSTYTYTDEQGNEQTGQLLRLDRQTGLFIGKGGRAQMLSTNVGFTKDSIDALRQLFLLWLNETHIPELIWGGAIASSKASAESQMPPFIQYVNFRRLMLEGQGANPALGTEARGGLLELIDLWLRMYKLLNPSIVVGPVQIDWPEIDLFNDQLRYMWGTYLNGTGKITDESVVKLSGYFNNPAEEVMKASGKKARPPQFDAYEERLRAARLDAAKASMEPANDDGKPWSTDYVTPFIDRNDSDNINDTANHEHATGEAAKGDPWAFNSPIEWIGFPSGREDSVP